MQVLSTTGVQAEAQLSYAAVQHLFPRLRPVVSARPPAERRIVVRTAPSRSSTSSLAFQAMEDQMAGPLGECQCGGAAGPGRGSGQHDGRVVVVLGGVDELAIVWVHGWFLTVLRSSARC
jgi:hypothetical protein